MYYVYPNYLDNFTHYQTVKKFEQIHFTISWYI